jgi:hypothetical protein
MPIQSLAEFRQTFICEPVKVELTGEGYPPFECYLKPMTSRDRDAYEASVAGIDGKRDLDNLRARLVAKCLCDESGDLICKNAKHEGILGGLPSIVIRDLFERAAELNGMEALEEAGKD